MKTLIKNGRIVTAVDDYRADILIEVDSVGLCLEHEKSNRIVVELLADGRVGRVS